MKKDLFILVLMLATIAFLVCGCQESEKVVEGPKLRNQLIPLNTSEDGRKWAAAFGDNIETAQSLNLVLLNNAFAKLKNRMNVLEAKDPNEISDLKGRVELLEESQSEKPGLIDEISKDEATLIVSCLVHNCSKCKTHIGVEPNK